MPEQAAQYLVADARDTETLFSKNSFEPVDLVLTSPPYFDVKNYVSRRKQIGYRQTYEEYLSDVADVMGQCYRVSKANATLWLVADSVRREGIVRALPFDIDRQLRQPGQGPTWILRDVIIWNRSKNIPWHSKGRLKNEFEYILFFSKNNAFKYHVDRVRTVVDYKKWWLSYPERYNPKGRPPSNVWEFPVPIRGWGYPYQPHVCPFPFGLVERVLSMCSDEGDTVLDPFAGSGSVLALAAEMNRRAIGLDVSRRYKRQYEDVVVRGAARYWETRSKELHTMREGMQSFERFNVRLRKIKAGMQLKEAVTQEGGAGGAVFFLIDKGDETRQVDFVVCGEAEACRAASSALEGCLDGVRREYGVTAHVSAFDARALLAGCLGRAQLFGYAKHAIHRYTGEYKVVHVIENHADRDLLFTNIKMKLDDPGALFSR
ncbi:MAG: site-specific DNA-methyltransferase [Chloroflexota bacterium]|nr:site-specific DNA-methyltransferase [Chloroflexota bacterium]